MVAKTICAQSHARGVVRVLMLERTSIEAPDCNAGGEDLGAEALVEV